MSKRPSLKKKIVVLLAMTTTVVGAVRQDLPEGNGHRGAEIARNKCLNCHEADLITSQRLAKPGWTREVDKMIRWGAVVSDADKEPLIEYLVAHFGPQRNSSKKNEIISNSDKSTERGKEIFENQCTLCHETDLTTQQRLGRPGWMREIDKMIRWGAVVSDADKEPLIDYLVKNYGPRK